MAGAARMKRERTQEETAESGKRSRSAETEGREGENRAEVYARWCAEDRNELAPRYVKLQAASWLAILEGRDTEACFDEVAYRTALEANFMQPDEVRFAEDMEPLGLNFIKLGLQDVLYDPKTGAIYTPNTDKTGSLTNQGEAGESHLTAELGDDKVEEIRGGAYIQDPKSGRMKGSKPGNGNQSKYAPSQQRSHEGKQLGAKRYARLCGILGARYPGIEAGEIRTIVDSTHVYTVKADGYGGFITIKIERQ